MQSVTFKGKPIKIAGLLPKLGASAPDFHLLQPDLQKVSLEDFSGKKKILNIFISLDTPVCSQSVHQFCAKVAQKSDTVLLNISMDLPFAASRFCSASGLKNVTTLSTFHSSFAKDYGVEIAEGPLEGLCARAVVVIGDDNKVLYTELVPEITQEPNYEKALQVL